MTNITICLTYFRSLTLANLRAALFSVRRQDFSQVNSLVIIDNNTEDAYRTIVEAIDQFHFPVPVYFSSFKHGDPSKTHAWSTNAAVDRAETSWVFFTRADYLLEGHALAQFVAMAAAQPDQWRGCITSYGFHLAGDIGAVEQTPWRRAEYFPTMPGSRIDYTEVDSGVWCMPKRVFQSVNGLDERLTAWGHAQTEFQHRLHETGTEFIVIPKVLFYHPMHGGPRDLDAANRQLAAVGGDLRSMWHRHPGVY